MEGERGGRRVRIQYLFGDWREKWGETGEWLTDEVKRRLNKDAECWGKEEKTKIQTAGMQANTTKKENIYCLMIYFSCLYSSSSVLHRNLFYCTSDEVCWCMRLHLSNTSNNKPPQRTTRRCTYRHGTATVTTATEWYSLACCAEARRCLQDWIESINPTSSTYGVEQQRLGE